MRLVACVLVLCQACGEAAGTPHKHEQEEKLQFTMNALNSRDRFCRATVLDADLGSAVTWIAERSVHEVIGY